MLVFCFFSERLYLLLLACLCSVFPLFGAQSWNCGFQNNKLCFCSTSVNNAVERKCASKNCQPTEHPTVGLRSAPSLNSHFKVRGTTTESYFLEMPLVISYAIVFACVLVALSVYTVRRLRWTLSYGSCLKKEQEKAGWEERNDGVSERVQERKTDLAACARHSHWLSTTVWMTPALKSLQPIFKFHLHFREILQAWAKEVVLL